MLYARFAIKNNPMMTSASEQEKAGFRAGLIQYYEVALNNLGE